MIYVWWVSPPVQESYTDALHGLESELARNKMSPIRMGKAPAQQDSEWRAQRKNSFPAIPLTQVPQHVCPPRLNWGAPWPAFRRTWRQSCALYSTCKLFGSERCQPSYAVRSTSRRHGHGRCRANGIGNHNRWIYLSQRGVPRLFLTEQSYRSH